MKRLSRRKERLARRLTTVAEAATNGAAGKRPIGSVVSYYARPATFTSGGVNASRFQWLTSMLACFSQVSMVDANNGYQSGKAAVTSDSGPPSRDGLSHHGIRHLGRRRQTMIPLGLAKHLREADLLVLHEGWTVSNLVAGAWACWHGLPYIIFAHGVYEQPIADSQRFKLARRPLERLLLEHALAVHVFFDSETDHVRLIAPKTRTIAAPTPFTVSRRQWTGNGTDIVWVGRFDIWHKGLDILVDAMEEIPKERRPRLCLFGPDHLGDKAICSELIEKKALSPWISVGDSLSAQERDLLFSTAAAVVHPARWESFGRVIAEALAVGVPVILSESVHLARLLRETSAALIFDGSSKDLAVKIDGTTSRDLAEIGAAGRRWLSVNLTPETCYGSMFRQLALQASDALDVDVALVC